MKSPKLAKNTRLDTFLMSANIYRSFAIACANPAIYKEGYEFWDNANLDVQNALSIFAQDSISLDVDKMSNFVACVSPSRYWHQNMVDAIHGVYAWYRLPHEYDRIAHLYDCHVSLPYGASMFIKGWAILDGAKRIAYNGAPKTFSMGDNVALPNTSQEITIDQHMVHLMLGDGKRGSLAISSKQYKRFADVLRECANVLGILPCRLQAIVWIQRQYELKGE